MARDVKNHTVSACYLDQWADHSGSLTVTRLRAGKQQPASPRSVGWRRKFWGEDEAQRAEIERTLCDLENRAGPIVRTLPDRWPIHEKRDDWFALLQFVALHLIRTPFWRTDMRAIQRDAVVQQLPVWRAKLPAEAIEELIRTTFADEFQNDTMLGQIPKTASVLGSMHCSLLAFEDASLLTSDHPAVPVPLLGRGERAGMRPLPAGGLMKTVEFRFPVGPHHALLFTWFDRPQPREILSASFSVACDINRSVAAQADLEWYRHPGTRPAFVSPPFLSEPCRPIGPLVLEGYDQAHALSSRRRRETDRIMERLIEGDVTDRVEVVTVAEDRAA